MAVILSVDCSILYIKGNVTRPYYIKRFNTAEPKDVVLVKFFTTEDTEDASTVFAAMREKIEGYFHPHLTV